MNDLRRSRGWSGWVLVVAALTSCSDAPPAGPVVGLAPEWTQERTREADALAARLSDLEAGVEAQLRVHLAFAADVDLDLYVTGPQEESVYYANSPSRMGGELLEDRRCEHSGPRTETVRFPLAPGRYRVGVDYPHACGDSKAPAPFALRVEAPGYHEQLRGLASYQVFEPVVFEFELKPELDPEVNP